MTEIPSRPPVAVPAMGLVVLVGVSGSGKSTFARTHFKPTEVVSSDFCRGLVADDENDQSATPDAFDVLHYIVGTRLRRGLLTVVDATNVQQQDRASLVKLARSHDVLVDAIVLDVPESLAPGATGSRPDRDFGAHVVSRPALRRLGDHCAACSKEGFHRVHVLRGDDEIEAADIHARAAMERPARTTTARSTSSGTSTAVASELRTLLAGLGWQLRYDGDAAVGASHPEREAGGLPRRPRRPRTRHPRRAATGDGHGRQGTRCACPVTTRSSWYALSRAPTSRCPTAWPSHWRSSAAEPRGLPQGVTGLHGRPDQPLRARRWQARRRSRRAAWSPITAGRPGGCDPSPSTVTPPARPTSTGCPCATRGRSSTAARRWLSTATPRCPRPNGSTTPSASTPAWSSAGP